MVAASTEPGVEELPQILSALCCFLRPYRIGLVNDQGRWVVLVDGSEQRSNGRVDGGDRLVAGVFDHIEEPGLAAPFHWGPDA
jgi:hypothetical protein